MLKGSDSMDGNNLSIRRVRRFFIIFLKNFGIFAIKTVGLCNGKESNR